jgi:hypothetical protein
MIGNWVIAESTTQFFLHLCSPPTTAFILACAEEEVAALTGGADGPQLRP